LIDVRRKEKWEKDQKTQIWGLQVVLMSREKRGKRSGNSTGGGVSRQLQESGGGERGGKKQKKKESHLLRMRSNRFMVSTLRELAKEPLKDSK